MPENPKCVYYGQCDNVNGRIITLTIVKYGNHSMEIISSYINEGILYRKGLLLFFLVTLNLYSFIFAIISTNYCIAILLIAIVFGYSIIFTVEQERILITRSLGYQIVINYVFGRSIQFIPWENIQSIFINEIVSKQRVIFIAAFLTKDTSKDASAIIPLFNETLPRLSYLEIVYNYIKWFHS